MDEIYSETESTKPDHYSLIWVTDGMVDLSVDGVLTSLNADQMIFFTPLSYIKVLANHGKVNILQFNREFYCIRENDHEVSCDGILYFGSQGISILNLEPKEVESFETLMKVLFEEFEIKDTIQEEMLRAILKKWLIKSTRILRKQNKFVGQTEPRMELFRQFNILLEKNYFKLHNVKDYADLLNRSPKTISNQFKLLGQESPSRSIQQRIIIEAKKYLLYSSLSIKEIAYKLGFEDASSFSHHFKKGTGISPSLFTKN